MSLETAPAPDERDVRLEDPDAPDDRSARTLVSEKKDLRGSATINRTILTNIGDDDLELRPVREACF